MFNQLISAFQGFFARSFWFASFLPVAIFVALNALIASVAFPSRVHAWLWLTKPTETAAWVPAVFAIMVVCAYAITPVIPVIRGWLDGTLMPDWLYDRLRREHGIQVRAARDSIDLALRDFNVWTRKNREAEETLSDARAFGNALADAPDETSVAAAEGAVKDVRKGTDKGKLPRVNDVTKDIDSVTNATRVLVDALRANSCRLPSTHPNRRRAMRLDAAHRSFIRALSDGTTEARIHFAVLSERYRDFQLENPQATRVADARFGAEVYCWSVYAVRFDYLWPRLQLVVPADGLFMQRIADSRAQVDFAVLSLGLLVIVPVVWLPLLALTATSPSLVLGVGALLPLIVRFFYELVVQSYVSFGEIVKTSIDKFRFDLLTKVLVQPLPPTRAAERAVWKRLREGEERAENVDLSYRQSPT
jgi:hypothetical protein